MYVKKARVFRSNLTILRPYKMWKYYEWFSELKTELLRCLEQMTWKAVHEQNWQGKLISARKVKASALTSMDVSGG